jgi:hypothetical protein
MYVNSLDNAATIYYSCLTVGGSEAYCLQPSLFN